MPPKRRQYRKPKAEKPVFFGPERPPPPQPPSHAAPLAPSSEANAPSQGPPAAQGGGEGAETHLSKDGQDDQAAARAEEGQGEAVAAEIGGKGKQRRRKIPRKKWAKETKGGWDADEELAPHQDDEGRYDPNLPYDLRLLRCCDEFRSLRSFRDKDVRVNYNTLLRFFQADILTLRASYGSQPLRGYDPEADQADEEDDDGDDDGGDAEEDPLQEAKVSLEGKTEEEWAGYVFDPGRLVKFFDNRSNDGYTPTLTLAPKIAGSFLKFQLARNVFPGYSEGIKACIEVCEMAGKQLLPASILLKQLKNHDGLSATISRLFTPSSTTTATISRLFTPSSTTTENGGETASAFSLPIPFTPDPALLAADDAPDALHSVYDISQKTLAEIERMSEQLGPQTEEEKGKGDWAEWKKREGGGSGGKRGKAGGSKGEEGKRDKDQDEAVKEDDEETARLNRVKKQFELDAAARRKWTFRSRSTATAASQLAASTQRLSFVGEGKEKAASWILGSRERSARTLEGWEVVAGTPVPPSVGAKGKALAQKQKEGQGEEKKPEGSDRLLVKLKFGAHEEGFPLTTHIHAPPASTLAALEKASLPPETAAHDLSSPVEVVVDLPAFFNLEHLTTLHRALFEADLTQLVFVPTGAASTSSSAASASLPSLWVFTPLYRLVPPYWTHTTELLREEPREVGRAEWDVGEDAEKGLAKVRRKWEEEEERAARVAEGEEGENGDGKEGEKEGGRVGDDGSSVQVEKEEGRLSVVEEEGAAPSVA
ncbi:hypothetical protein JCM6882_000745 [Rhodosporidiobolus microsporus]